MPKIDWRDLDQVIAFANELGKGMTVYADHAVCSYGITHTERKDRWSQPHRDVMYQTV